MVLVLLCSPPSPVLAMPVELAKTLELEFILDVLL